MSAPTREPVRLGLRANLAQFSLLVAVNALVGGMLGQERTVVPLLAAGVFHLQAVTAALTFILAFGAVKAATNFFAGTASDRFGRKPVLVAGWLIALPIPLLLIWAPYWGWVIAANVLLGASQGLTWSTTVIMKIDLAGPQRRGLAMGLNEAAGYGAVAVTAMATGFIAARWGLRPAPFFLGIAYAALGLGLSTLLVRETRGHARHEARTHTTASADLHGGLSTAQVFTPRSAGSPPPTDSLPGWPVRSSSAPGRPWCTPPSSPSLAMSPTPPGEPPPSACIGCGATAASPSARSSPASLPTGSVCPLRSGPSRPSPPSAAS